jgi:hypothetical protein
MFMAISMSVFFQGHWNLCFPDFPNFKYPFILTFHSLILRSFNYPNVRTNFSPQIHLKHEKKIPFYYSRTIIKTGNDFNPVLLSMQARRHDFVIGAANLHGLSQILGGYGGMLPRKFFYSRMLSGPVSRIFGTVYSLPLVQIIVIC